MAVKIDMDWKKQYASAVEKNRDWRDLYALISGRKGRPLQSYVREELNKNKDRLIDGLKYFQSQEVNQSLGRENSPSPGFGRPNSSWNQEKKIDVTVPFLMKKLHSMTGVESGLAWEVLSNYLQYAFRGPPDSLQKLLAQNEEKAEAIVADLFCFYYRERMFILKILYHILTHESTDFYNEAFSDFVKENVAFSDLYKSLCAQLRTVSTARAPNLSCLSHLSAPRYAAFWVEHNHRERVQLLKLMIVTLRHCKELPPVTSIRDVLDLLEESKVTERESSLRTKESPHKFLHKLFVVHFIQLIRFDMLSAEDARWSLDQRGVFTTINERVKFSVDRKSEEGAALLSVWFIVHSLTPLGTQSETMRELIYQTVKAANPWQYFGSLLVCQDLLEDRVVSEVAHYAVYQVAFLSVVNFGLDYVRGEDFARLTALVLRDAQVFKHFWLTENDGLQLVLKEWEQFFPVVWRPVFDVYSAVASHGEFYANEIEKRVEKQVKFTQVQTRVINMESLGSSVFRSLEPVQPLASTDKLIIPAGTRCMVSGDKDILIHWDFSVPVWHLVKDILLRWSHKMTEYPRPSEHELQLLRQNVLSTLNFYEEILRSRKEHKKIVFSVVDEMFTRLEMYHQRKDGEMLNVCLKICTQLLKYYPKDVLMLLEVSHVIPDMDKVIMDHVQCARGDFYHSNGVKKVLELVELNSGRFPVLVSYLEFVLELFSLPWVYESWPALAGLQFVLRDVFPHYHQWTFAEERQRIRVEWLCVRILSAVLDVSLEDVSPPRKSEMKHLPLPSRNLFANTALHHLLNWEPAIALIHIVSIGDQQLFSCVEHFHSWLGQSCSQLVGSVHSALAILDKCILFKHLHTSDNSLTRLEREIYKEPKETDTYRVVINVAGYVYNFLSPEVRFHSVKLLSRFADNRHQSLMACIGMEANTMRQMYLKPLYSSTESEEIKVAILELVTECIHKQASLAEAFLNALELKECVQKEEGEESEGFVHIALSIIKKRKERPSDRVFLASVQLLQALWQERRTLVISYIRLRPSFFPTFCHPLFHVTDQHREVVPAYAYILTCLGTEMYWHKDQVNPALKTAMVNLIDNGHLVRLSLYCTDQLRGLDWEGEVAPTHTADSTKVLIAWKEFVYVLVKTFPEEIARGKNVQHVLCVHTLNALANEISRQGNMLAVGSLAELYLLLVTLWPLERTDEQNLVALKKISLILSQLSVHYELTSESVVLNILASCCRFFQPLSATNCSNNNSDWNVHMERVVCAVCTLLSRELESVLFDKRTKQTLPPLLCLSITLGQVVTGETALLWRELVTRHHITSQLVQAITDTLQSKETSDGSLLMLELLSQLTRGGHWSLRQGDLLQLHTAWDCLKPPLHSLFSPEPVCLEERSLFEVTNWFPVYTRALDLVSALVSHSCPDTRELGYDFIYQHDKFICDIFEFKEDSLKEPALELVSSALRLLWQVTQVVLPWDWKLKTLLARILDKVKAYVSILVDLLGDPDLLLRRKVMSQNQKLFSSPELLSKETHAEIQQLQNRLVGVLMESMCVLKQSCPAHADLLTADRFGLPLNKLRLLPEPRPQCLTLITLVNMVSKRLASNLRVPPRLSSTPTSTQAAIGKSTSPAPDTSPLSASGKDESFSSVKLASCSPSELKLLLELTVHYLIATSLLTILSDHMNFHQSVLFLRDLSTEAKTFLEYGQRLRYAKEDSIRWAQQVPVSKSLRSLTWHMGAVEPLEDSVSLGCAVLPEDDSDDASSSSPEDSVSEKRRKKLKTNELRLPEGLEHFLPKEFVFDPTFENRVKYSADKDFDSSLSGDDEAPEFILFCNNLLKQVFGMHGFDERSLRGGLL